MACLHNLWPPAANKRRPFELCGQAGDSLHKRVTVSLFPILSLLPPFYSLWKVGRRACVLCLQLADNAAIVARRLDNSLLVPWLDSSLPVQQAHARLFVQQLCNIYHAC